MSEHTKERWDFDYGYVPPDGPKRYADIYDDNETIIAQVNDCIPEGIANGKRIVACVNACQGIKNPEVLPEVVEFLRHIAGRKTRVREVLEARDLLSRLTGGDDES